MVIDDTDYSNFSRDDNLDLDYEEWLKNIFPLAKS